MMSPTILIPQNSTSTDLILLKSGDLHVQNVFDTTDIGQGVKQEWNHIYVSLTDVMLNRLVFFFKCSRGAQGLNGSLRLAAGLVLCP